MGVGVMKLSVSKLSKDCEEDKKMGMNMICRSSSSFDNNRGYSSILDSGGTCAPKNKIIEPKLPNPDPANWVFVKGHETQFGSVLMIRYPDCTNYEGKKILVFLDASIAKVRKQRLVDPHFSNNKDYLSPFARFEPTDAGWKAACFLIEKDRNFN